MKSKVLRLVCSAAAVFLVTLVSWIGISFGPNATTWQKVLTAFVVAIVLGVVNMVLKPIINILTFPLLIIKVLMFGLFSVVVNIFLFWLSGVIVRNIFNLQFDVPIWPGAVVGAIFVSVVTSLLGLIIKDYSK